MGAGAQRLRDSHPTRDLSARRAAGKELERTGTIGDVAHRISARDGLALATITWARDAGEESLLRRSLTTLAATQLPMAVADAGGNPSFAEFLAALPNSVVTTPAESGLVEQVKASMRAAARSGAASILYTESDKQEFFADGLESFIAGARAVGGDALVLAARSARSFDTFPPMQRFTEGVINQLCAELMHVRGDFSYGPFLLPRVLADVVIDLPSSLGWGWRIALFRAAHRRGMPIRLLPGEYGCPAHQLDEDESERRHRIRQLAQNLAGLVD